MYLLKIAQALTSRRYRSPDLFSAALKSVTSNQKRRQKSNVLLSLELLKTKQTEIYIDRLDNPGLFILERPLDPGGGATAIYGLYRYVQGSWYVPL